MEEKVTASFASLDKRLALLEQRLDIIQKNHLHQMQEDITGIKRGIKWGVGVVFIQLIVIIGTLISNMS